MAKSSFLTDSSRWAAVSSRDPEAEGCFVYCVRTTKIYCRPTCKARLARRSNVEYFDTAVRAEAAGYRACKRCQPNLETFVPNNNKMVSKVRALLDKLSPGSAIPSLETLAAEAGMTKHHFHRSFKKITGATPREYALSKQRKPSNSDEASVNATEKPVPSLVGDSLMSSTIGTPVGEYNLFDQFSSWNSWGLDDLFQYNDLDWQDLPVFDLDKHLSEWADMELTT